MRNLRWTAAVAFTLASLHLASCGFGKQTKKPKPEPVVVEKPKPKPPPPPPPVCVRPGSAMSLIGMLDANDAEAKFCVSDGEASNLCYGVDLATKKYSELDVPPAAQAASLDPDPARVETTPTEVKVCVGEECKTLKPKMPKGNQNPIDAVVNATGTYVAVMMGNAEAGKGTVELWDVGKGKKLATIKYAKGDYKCGEAKLLGDTLFVSASVCAGPAARGWLFNLKGKKVADVGGKEFGTYGTVPVQVADNVWAFLDENAAAIALQDVVTGKVAQTIDIGGIWGGGAAAGTPADGEGEEAAADAPMPAMGNPGESMLVRGGEGKLVVVTGSPTPGNVGVVDLASGALADSTTALLCEVEATAEPASAAPEEPAGEE
jgi:hypothetical protein